MIDLSRLTAIAWEERWMVLEARGAVDLPAYAGSTLRGSLGTVMRPALCANVRGCGERCAEPERCRFYSLFEQSRTVHGRGSNIPKPLIMEAPLCGALRAIAVGGTVTTPYEMRPGGAIPILSNLARVPLEEGERIRVGLRGLGAAGAALDGVVAGVGEKGLAVNGGRLALVGAEGGRASLGEVLQRESGYNGGGPGVRRVRLALVTPTLIKAGSEICLDPARLARLVLDQAVIRTVSLFNAFFARGEDRVPFVEPKWPFVSLTSHRLFHYRLPRRSYRQGRWMDFDGVVGWLEWEGEVASILPWLRAAEILHVGQKATFGLGKVEVLAS